MMVLMALRGNAFELQQPALHVERSRQSAKSRPFLLLAMNAVIDARHWAYHAHSHSPCEVGGQKETA
jgi:hypothetical protein